MELLPSSWLRSSWVDAATGNYQMTKRNGVALTPRNDSRSSAMHGRWALSSAGISLYGRMDNCYVQCHSRRWRQRSAASFLSPGLGEAPSPARARTAFRKRVRWPCVHCRGLEPAGRFPNAMATFDDTGKLRCRTLAPHHHGRSLEASMSDTLY